MIVDSDSHINEPLDIFERFLEEPYKSRRPRIIKDAAGFTRIQLDGKLYPDPRLRQAHARKLEGPQLGGSQAGASDPQARENDLDCEGIDVQVVFGTLGLALTTISDWDFTMAMSRACNDYYAWFCRTSPRRFRCMATLPLHDMTAAVEEMKRATKELGHVGITMPPNLDGKNLDHPDFYPLYEAAQNLGIPVGVHWGNGSHLRGAGTERFDSSFMSHLVGHPFEQMIALSSVICGGVVEKFPRLRFGFMEAGCGWLPYWLERMDEHYERRSTEMPIMTCRPSEYFRRGNCYVTAELGEVMLPSVIEVIGDDSILFGSDYPHSDSKFPYSVRNLMKREDVSSESKRKILSNGARFLGLA